jgi:cytoskeletal protein CcmA (bactofilin family)
MFSKGDKTVSQTKAPVKSDGAPSIISANLHIVGDMNTDGEIQVDGTVDGDVKGNSVTIGTNATVNGEIAADIVVVRGAVNGRIKADTVQLAESAKVSGDIWHQSLAVEAGALLEGHCKRWSPGDEKKAAAEPPGVSKKPPEDAEEEVVATPLTGLRGGRPA